MIMELMRVSEDIKDGMEVQAVIFITKGTEECDYLTFFLCIFQLWTVP